SARYGRSDRKSPSRLRRPAFSPHYNNFILKAFAVIRQSLISPVQRAFPIASGVGDLVLNMIACY
ncbi:MAG TPA: hypothetical protein VEP89_05175, partial [Draconibacterium sp.]|nr:hypothetical protein [Draconibacterium sp.]